MDLEMGRSHLRRSPCDLLLRLASLALNLAERTLSVQSFVGRGLACVARLSNGAWKNFLGKRRRRHISLRCSICRSTSTISAFEQQQTTPSAGVDRLRLGPPPRKRIICIIANSGARLIGPCPIPVPWVERIPDKGLWYPN